MSERPTTGASPCARPTSSTSAARSPGPSRAAPTRCRAADGRFLANAALASRKDARDAVVAARKAFARLVGGHRLQPGPGPLPGGRDARGPARPVRRRGGRRRGRRRGGAAGARSTPPSTAGSGTPAGATRSTRCAARPTPWRGPTSTSRCPSPPAWWRWWRPASSLLGLVSVVAPVVVTGNTCVVVAPEARARCPAVTLAEVLATSDVPGGVVNLLTGRAAEIAPWLASHMDVNAIDLAGVTDADAGHRARAGRGRQPQAGRAPARRRARLGRRPGPRPHAGLPRDQDRLAPGRHLSAEAPSGTTATALVVLTGPGRAPTGAPAVRLRPPLDQPHQRPRRPGTPCTPPRRAPHRRAPTTRRSRR